MQANNMPKLMTAFTKMVKYQRQACSNLLSEYRFTPNELDVLLFLATHPELDTSKEICELRAFSRSLVSRSVESLVEKGLLSTQVDRQDRRCVHLKLNDSARPIIEMMEAQRTEFFDYITHDIDEESMEVFSRVMKQMSDNATELLHQKEHDHQKESR